MHLLSFPKTTLQSGSFVADFRMELDSQKTFDEAIKWTPTSNELRALSQVGQTIALSAQPFEYLNIKLEEAQNVLQDDYRLASFSKETDSKSPTLYRVGNYVQVNIFNRPLTELRSFVATYFKLFLNLEFLTIK